MVSQLKRSAARKRLTSLCSKAILNIISSNTSPKSNEEKMYQAYLSALKITIGCAFESMIGKPIPPELTTDDRVLSFFDGELEGIVREKGRGTVSDLCIFVTGNLAVLAEEDLGGVSELFSGHRALWKNESVVLEHNPARRGAGKIYTPFDVTHYMCSKIARQLLSRCDTEEELFQLKILDPAVGSGAFCSQLIRILWTEASLKWKLKDENHFRMRVSQEMIFSCDIDQEALKLAKVVLWISAGAPEKEIKFHITHCDSLQRGPCKNKEDWFAHTGQNLGEGFDIVFGNPPYVRIQPNDISEFEVKNSRNLYCAFIEIGLNLLNQNGMLCYIVPQSVVGSKETKPLREMLLQQNACSQFQIFDSVPDFLFDQGKVEANTNTNINQRTAIITINRSLEKSIYTSPLLRWRRREERDELFSALNEIKINQSDIHNGIIPMLENKEDLKLYRKLNSQRKSIADVIVKDGGKVLHIPKAIRYFITAVPFDLGRKNTLKVRVEEQYFETVFATLNSNLFYWWWRVLGNGFQVEMKDIISFPILPIERKRAVEICSNLVDAIDDCRVFKRNAGKDIPNVNFNIKQPLIQSIDISLLHSIGMEPHQRVFGCKTNSLHGKMDALRGYKT